MSKWLPTLIVIAVIGALAWASLHMYGKVSGLEENNAVLSKQVKAEQAKTQAIIEEYNALKQIQDEGDRKKQVSKEKTDAAKASHVKSGVPVYASKHDAGLLQQRSLEVRGEAAGDSGKPDR